MQDRAKRTMFYHDLSKEDRWTVFVEAPTAPGRISPLEAKWICGHRRLFRAIHPFLQVPPPLLTR